MLKSSAAAVATFVPGHRFFSTELYCNHGNVLFPTWHRAYLLRLKDALGSIPGCADVVLPFWDEASDDSVAHGIPLGQTHLEAKAFIPLHAALQDAVPDRHVEVEVHTRDGLLAHSQARTVVARAPFRFEVR